MPIEVADTLTGHIDMLQVHNDTILIDNFDLDTVAARPSKLGIAGE